MWKLVSCKIYNIERNIPALMLTYDNEKLSTSKAVAYFFTKSFGFKLIPEYDFVCMLVDFEDYEEEFKVYETTVQWLWFAFHKRFNFIKEAK